MKRIFLGLIISFLFCNLCYSQNKYWVFFSDKSGVSFQPTEYFSNRTIKRRLKYNISLIDSSDFDISDKYLSLVKSTGCKLTGQSRWLNAIGILASDAEIKKISKFSFVKNIEKMRGVSVCASFNQASELLNRNISTQYRDAKTIDYDTRLFDYEIDLLIKQTGRHGLDVFEKHNLNGKGIRICLVDAGFPHVNTSPVFKHLYDNSRIIDTYDFVRKTTKVYHGNVHGTMTLSCIAGIADGRKMGLATESEFLLARTETVTENFSEEENWIMAVEWADKNGADIISSSLGYSYHRYFPEDMDGKTSLISRAANFAAAKGLLVINALGNEGSERDKWKYLITPADADSVLAIGGIDPYDDCRIEFSSFGPTADKRMKPNVAAYGEVIAAGRNRLELTQGTSFSCPLIAGFAACAWQSNRELTNMQLFHEIEKSGNLYPYFDYVHGFGIPRAEYFVDGENYKPTKRTFKFEIKNDNLHVIVDKNVLISNLYENGYLYFHVENTNGYLDEYSVLMVYQEDVLCVSLKMYEKGEIVRVYYKGYTDEYIVE